MIAATPRPTCCSTPDVDTAWLEIDPQGFTVARGCSVCSPEIPASDALLEELRAASGRAWKAMKPKDVPDAHFVFAHVDDVVVELQRMRAEALARRRKIAPASRAAAMVLEVNVRDIPHRKGWRPSEHVGVPTLEHLRGETVELDDALDEVRHHQGREDLEAYTAALAHAREEVADVFACVLQVAYRLGMTFPDLDAEAERKIRLRFIGAADVVLPGDEAVA